MQENDSVDMREVIFVGQASVVDHKAFVLGDEVDLNIKKIPDGFSAMKYVLTEDKLPDLVIIDLLAEKINGLHFCYITKKLLQIEGLKIILFSEHSHRNNIIKGIQSGAADYIIDPCSDVLFKDRVLYHLYEAKAAYEKSEDEDFSRWKFITVRKDAGMETIFIEKRISENESEIKKISRDTSKKDFGAIRFADPTVEDFNSVKYLAPGDPSRFVEPSKYDKDEEFTKPDVPVVSSKSEKEDGPDFGKKKLDLYKKIEPRERIEVQESGEERDRILQYNDLRKIAADNRDLKILLNIDKEVSANKNKHDCMFNVINQISNFIEMVRASIIVPSSDKKTGMVLVANDDRSLENFKIDLNKYPEILKCLESGEIIFIEDVNKSDILSGVLSRFIHLNYYSIIVVPIWHNGRVIAVLSIRGKKGGREISYEDIVFCQIIASAAARPVAGNVFLQKIMRKFLPRSK